MTWNWEHNNWPDFLWDRDSMVKLEEIFLHQSGIVSGTIKHFDDDDSARFIVEVLTTEALKTSEIEGEILNRDSVQVSIQRNFGLETDHRRVEPAEQGIADMMTDLYHNYNEPLSHSMLHRWHNMITQERQDIKSIGQYRTHPEPMQVVSGPLHRPVVHFEAPPSKIVQNQMNIFLEWYNSTSSNGSTTLSALTRASIAHLYFVSIHPFEDSNGRIARAIAEKSLSEYVNKPALTLLSQTIDANKKEYYNALERNNKDLEITGWLNYFSKTLLDAQSQSLELIEFLIEKTKLYDRTKDLLNNRQSKVINRMFREGPKGFLGGLSTKNYLSITGTSRATATRDLQDLVQKEILIQIGTRKSTRYFLNTKNNKIKRNSE